MFLVLLKSYLESADRPVRKSLVSTVVSFALCALPLLSIIAGDWILHLIREWLQLLPPFDFVWLNYCIQRLLRGIAWIIENLTLLATPVTIVLLGSVYVHFYRRRSSIMVMVAIYVFKRATEPLLALHLAALSVKWLIGFKTFYSVDHLLNDMGLQVFGNGWMVTITLATWFMLTLGLNLQLSIVRKEKAALGEFAVLEEIRLALLGWVEKRLSNQSSTHEKRHAQSLANVAGKRDN